VGIDLLVRHAWAAHLAWAALFVADYALTVWGARLMTGISDRIVMEGSYELNPFHAPAIDAGRRFRLVPCCSSSWWPRFWPGDRRFVGVRGGERDIDLRPRPADRQALGQRLPFQATGSAAAEGRLRYRRWAAFRLSAWGMAVWAGVFGLLPSSRGGSSSSAGRSPAW
jgi:hypothetical protein